MICDNSKWAGCEYNYRLLLFPQFLRNYKYSNRKIAVVAGSCTPRPSLSTSIVDESVPTLAPARTHLLHVEHPFDLIHVRVFYASPSNQWLLNTPVSLCVDFFSLVSSFATFHNVSRLWESDVSMFSVRAFCSHKSTGFINMIFIYITKTCGERVNEIERARVGDTKKKKKQN